MVGFLHRDDEEEEESNNLSSSKLKNTVDPSWCDKLDFLDQFVPEIDDLSAPANSSFLDFDSIKDWLEEMQDPAFTAEAGVSEPRSEPASSLGGDVEVVELPAAVDDSGEGLRTESEGLENSPIEKGACFVKKEEMVTVDDSGEDLGISSVEKGGKGEELVSLNTLVEEGLGKVSLVDEVELNPVDESSGSESESESSYSSASSSSSGEDDDGVDEGVNKEVSKEVVVEVKEMELEEGEIMETGEEDGDEEEDDDVNEVDIFNKDFIMDDEDDDEAGGVKEPIVSKNELKVLPPVLPVDVTLQPSHQMLPVGVVSSTLGAQVIVEGAEKHNPLSEGSILWMTEKRSPLGRVDEIFGPVKNPYYIVRYNSESEVPEGMHEGILVSFVPEFVDHVLNNKDIYQKGYDASGDNDEEVLDEAEFSDDEKEAEYRRMLKMSKRGNNAEIKPGGNKKSNNKSFKRNDGHPRNYHQSNPMQDSPPAHQVESPVRYPTEHRSNNPSSSRFSPAFHSGPQPGPPAGFMPNGPRANTMPFQTPNGEFANGFQMPWIQHQQFQQPPPMMNPGPPFQQAFNPAGGVMGPNAMNQVPFSMALQAQLAQLSMLSGVLSNMQQQFPPTSQQNAGCNNMQQQFLPTLQQNVGGNNMQQQFPPTLQQNAGGNNMQQQFPPTTQQNSGGNNVQQMPPNMQQNAEASPQFNHGAGSGRSGRPFQRGGGRSGGRGGGRRGRGRGRSHPFQSR